jgi:glutamate-ammonia-ligase adenylyltransferase
VQFLILAHAESHPELATWPDNVRSIETLFAIGLLSEAEKDRWLKGYLALREEVHHGILAGQGKKIPSQAVGQSLAQIRTEITQAWEAYFAGVSPNEDV